MYGVPEPWAAPGARPARDVLPVVDRSYAEMTLARATAVLGNVRAEDEDREDAARVVQAILVRACPTEADLADVISALGRALHVHLAIRRVLGEIQRLRPPQVVDKAGRGVERLMAQAHQAGDHEALAELILVALEEPRWLPRIRDEWGKAATACAVNGLPARKYPVVLLIGGWLHSFGVVPDWMSEIAEVHPDLVTSGVLPAATRWQLHTAAPTVAGWHHLAGLHGAPPTIEPSLFGGVVDVAVKMLEQAIGENVDQAKRATLEAWFHELTGEVS